MLVCVHVFAPLTSATSLRGHPSHGFAAWIASTCSCQKSSSQTGLFPSFHQVSVRQLYYNGLSTFAQLAGGEKKQRPTYKMKKSYLLRVLFLIVGGGSSAAGGRNLKLPSPCLGVTTVVRSHGAMERLVSPWLHWHWRNKSQLTHNCTTTIFNHDSQAQRQRLLASSCRLLPTSTSSCIASWYWTNLSSLQKWWNLLISSS